MTQRAQKFRSMHYRRAGFAYGNAGGHICEPSGIGKVYPHAIAAASVATAVSPAPETSKTSLASRKNARVPFSAAAHQSHAVGAAGHKNRIHATGSNNGTRGGGNFFLT